MFKPTKEMTPARAGKLWNWLVKWERRLKRNVVLCRIIQPLGASIFTLNMLLSTMNLLYMFEHPSVVEKLSKIPLLSDILGSGSVSAALDKVPLLPAMVKSFPRESVKAALGFTCWFAFLIPLAVSALVLGVLLVLQIRKSQPIPALKGTEAQCAKALAHQAERVYQLRKKLPFWSVFAETTVLTALTAWPVLAVCLGFLGGEEPAILQITISVFALLVCLFVVFWVFAGCFWIFARLNSLYYYAPGEWRLWQLFNELDDHWESVDPAEYDRREKAEKKHG